MWTLDRRTDVPAWRDGSSAAGPRLAFSTRRGGVSEGPYRSLNIGRSTADRPEAIEENRRRLLFSLGLDPARLATAGQVHGASVRRVMGPGLHPDCDALVTRTAGIALAVTAADCLPILFTAPGAIGVAHAGWRGAAAGVAEAALTLLCDETGVGAGGASVHLGPCIRGCCYEVGPEVATLFPESALRRTGDRVRLDLPSAVRGRLEARGVPPAAIHDTGACTACDPEWYFSHRRDRGITGRQWGLAALL